MTFGVSFLNRESDVLSANVIQVNVDVHTKISLSWYNHAIGLLTLFHHSDST